MKAILALVVMYVGAFLLAIQGSAPVSVEAAPQSASGAQTVSATLPAIDPSKEADIRSLLELVGAHDQVQESVRFSAEQYREKLLATVPENEKGRPSSTPSFPTTKNATTWTRLPKRSSGSMTSTIRKTRSKACCSSTGARSDRK